MFYMMQYIHGLEQQTVRLIYYRLARHNFPIISSVWSVNISSSRFEMPTEGNFDWWNEMSLVYQRSFVFPKRPPGDTALCNEVVIQKAY